jgi:hypothetical protein
VASSPAATHPEGDGAVVRVYHTSSKRLEPETPEELFTRLIARIEADNALDRERRAGIHRSHAGQRELPMERPAPTGDDERRL